MFLPSGYRRRCGNGRLILHLLYDCKIQFRHIVQYLCDIFTVSNYEHASFTKPPLDSFVTAETRPAAVGIGGNWRLIYFVVISRRVVTGYALEQTLMVRLQPPMQNTPGKRMKLSGLLQKRDSRSCCRGFLFHPTFNRAGFLFSSSFLCPRSFYCAVKIEVSPYLPAPPRLKKCGPLLWKKSYSILFSSESFLILILLLCVNGCCCFSESSSIFRAINMSPNSLMTLRSF